MKKVFILMVVAIMFITTILFDVTKVEARSKYIENKFVFGSYAPTVIIHHPIYNWVLDVNQKGELVWAKPVKDKQSQLFVILPTEYDGYYSIREFNNGTTEQLYIGYTKTGFKLVSNRKAKHDTIAYKFVWKKTDNCGGKTFNNVWRLQCKANKICFCNGGWGSFRFEQTNYY